MAKRLVVKVDEYQKDGQTKGKYTEVGVILSNDNGEYVLLDPAVSLSGVLAKQNSLASKNGKQERDMIMASIFTDEPKQQPQSPPQDNSGFDDDIGF